MACNPCGTQSWAVARAGWGSGPSWTHSRECHLVDWQPVGSPVGPQWRQLLSAVGQRSCEPAGRSQTPGLQAAMLGCGARTVLISQGAWTARSLLFCGRLPTLICLPQPKSPLEVSRKKKNNPSSYSLLSVFYVLDTGLGALYALSLIL